MENTALASWNIDPGKWPRLIVSGQPITSEQADHVLIRTACLHYLDCNDREWNRIVGRIVFGDETILDRCYGLRPFEQRRARARDLQVLDLEYLITYRISSSWIGGPRGWCDWDGRIGCASYTIGKWPTHQEVGREWAEIAQAFPFLDLHAQLISDEGERPGRLCAQWRVHGGAAVPQEIGAPLATAEAGDAADKADMDHFMDLLCGSERGVSAERLQRAVERVEEWATAP